jgi:hypothetical protein
MHIKDMLDEATELVRDRVREAIQSRTHVVGEIT